MCWGEFIERGGRIDLVPRRCSNRWCNEAPPTAIRDVDPETVPVADLEGMPSHAVLFQETMAACERITGRPWEVLRKEAWLQVSATPRYLRTGDAADLRPRAAR